LDERTLEKDILDYQFLLLTIKGIVTPNQFEEIPFSRLNESVSHIPKNIYASVSCRFRSTRTKRLTSDLPQQPSLTTNNVPIPGVLDLVFHKKKL
jgi:hypothetical protein